VKEPETGAKIADLARKHEITVATLYIWTSRSSLLEAVGSIQQPAFDTGVAEKSK
jgi:hypothetical protein